VDPLVHEVDQNGGNWPGSTDASGGTLITPSPVSLQGGGVKKKPFVKLDRTLLEHRAYRLSGPLARDLYTCMVNSLFNENNGGINHSSRRVSFGPTDARLFGIAKSTYYKHIVKLIDYCIVEEIEAGGHGKRAVYDLTAWKYKLDLNI
jgi:hypothetical protein